MPKKSSVRVTIKDHFAELTAPRRREVIYPLINVVTIALCAVICELAKHPWKAGLA